MLESILDKPITLRSALTEIIKWIIISAVAFFAIFEVGYGYSGILEASKAALQVSGVILGFSFIAIASLFRQLEKEYSKYFLRLLLKVVYFFTFVLILSMLSVFLASLPQTFSVFPLIIVFGLMIMCLLDGVYGLFIFIRRISRYFGLREIEDKFEKQLKKKRK